jgi:hypothetical protein
MFVTRVSRLFSAALLAAFGIATSAMGATVTQHFDTAPADWEHSGTANYNFQAAGDKTDTSPAPAPPGGTATGPGEAGGTSGTGGYYGAVLPGTLGLNDPLSVNGVMYLGGNEGGMLFGYVNSASLPLATDPREFRPAQFLGFRTNSGGTGHSIDLYINDASTGSNLFEQTAFARPGDPTPSTPGGPLFNTASPFSLTYDPGTAAGPNFGSISLFIGGATATDANAGETYTFNFTAGNRPNPAGISFNRLAMFGAEGQTAAFDDLTYTVSSGVVPEPASVGLLGAGALMMVQRRRRTP